MHDERNFEEDQRRTKELRRQQYNNRNSAKIREVIIFKIEYLKRRATQILEKWFESNTQGMNQAEILKHSQELQVDPDTFQKMHDVFIEDKTLFGKQTEELNKIIYRDNEKQETQQKASKKKAEPSTPTGSRRGKSARRVDKPNSPAVSKSEVTSSNSVADKKVGKHSQVVQKEEQSPTPAPLPVSPVEEQLRTKESDAWKRALFAINKEKDAQRKAEEARVLKLKNENEELRLKLNEEYRRAQEEANIYRKLRQEAEEEASKAEKARREAEIIKSQAEVEAALLKIAASQEAKSHRDELVHNSAQSSNHKESSNRKDESPEMRKSQESKDLSGRFDRGADLSHQEVYLNQAEQDGLENDDIYRRVADHDESEVPSPHSGKKDSQKSLSSIDQESNQKSGQDWGSSGQKHTVLDNKHSDHSSNQKQGAKGQNSSNHQNHKQDESHTKTLTTMAKHLQNQQTNRRSAESRTQRVETQSHQEDSKQAGLNAEQTINKHDEFKKAIHSIANSQRVDKTTGQEARGSEEESQTTQNKALKQETHQSQRPTQSQTLQDHTGRSSKDSAVARSVQEINKSAKDVAEQNGVVQSQREKASDKRVVASNEHTVAQQSQQEKSNQIEGSTSINRSNTEAQKSSKADTKTGVKETAAKGIAAQELTTKEAKESRSSRTGDSGTKAVADKKDQRGEQHLEETHHDNRNRIVNNTAIDAREATKTRSSQDDLKHHQADVSSRIRSSQQQKEDDSRASVLKEEVRNSKLSNNTKDLSKRRDLQARKQETRDGHSKKEVTHEADTNQSSLHQTSSNGDRRRVSERGINKLIEKKLEEAQQTRDHESQRDDARRSEEEARQEKLGESDLRRSLRQSQESLKQQQQKQEVDSKDSSRKLHASGDKQNASDSGSSTKQAAYLRADETEAEDQRSRSRAFRLEPAPQKSEQPAERVFTEAEVRELLQQRERELEALHRQDLDQLQRRTVHDVIQKKDSVREVCREQLWAKFLQYCDTELPLDEEFQRHLMNQTFLHFLQKHSKSDPQYFSEIEERCNQLIREDRLDD